MTTFIEVNKHNRCPVCDGDHKCKRHPQGLILCGRRSGPQPGFIDLGPCKGNPIWHQYRRDGEQPPLDLPAPTPPPRPAPKTDWGQRHRLLAAQFSSSAQDELAGLLGLPASVFSALPIGFQAVSDLGPIWFFPERDDHGAVIGLQRRFRDGSKRNLGRRGLCLPDGWAARPGPVFCVEGASDTLALHALGLAAVGRPSNCGGAELLAELLAGEQPHRDVLVVGERDQGPNGWPGRDGAVQVAIQLCRALGRSVRWTLPPEGFKDVRAWTVARALGPSAEEWHAAGGDLAALLQAASRPAEPAGLVDEAPVPLSTRLNMPTFPLKVLPELLRAYVEELAAALGCPADYVGVPVLAVAGAAMGNAWRLRLTSSHVQTAALFAAVVGPPGSAKSPALSAVTAPLHRINGEWLAEAERLREQAKGLGVELPVVTRRCVMDDFTTESVPPVLRVNPKGVVVIKDELAGLIHALNQYRGGKGHDRQVLLSLWSGFDVIVDRKSAAGPVHLRQPFVAIVGGIQPSVLAALQPRRGGVELEDGLLDRFLFAWPEPTAMAGETWRELSGDSREWWEVLLKRLLALGVQGTAFKPRELPLTESGKRAWEEFTIAHAQEANGPDVLAGPLAGAWSKLRVYCARLALILQALRWASGETGEDKGVDGASVRAAMELVGYFKRHVRKVHGALHTDPVQSGAERIVEWLGARPAVVQFTRGELYQHLRRHVQRPGDLEEPLALLTDLRYLSRLPGAVHRWQVNPLWHRPAAGS